MKDEIGYLVAQQTTIEVTFIWLKVIGISKVHNDMKRKKLAIKKTCSEYLTVREDVLNL